MESFIKKRSQVRLIDICPLTTSLEICSSISQRPPVFLFGVRDCEIEIFLCKGLVDAIIVSFVNSLMDRVFGNKDLLTLVLSHFSQQELLEFSVVNRLWNRVAKLPKFWKRFYDYRFGKFMTSDALSNQRIVDYFGYYLEGMKG
jgi:hypothetical protein